MNREAYDDIRYVLKALYGFSPDVRYYMKHDDDTLTVAVELAGVKKEDVKVLADDEDVVKIKYVRKPDPPLSKETEPRVFKLLLDKRYDTNQATAEMSDGILTLKFPRVKKEHTVIAIT